MTTKAEIDPLIGRTSLAGLTAAYLYGADLRAPLAPPLHTDLHGLPPLLMQVGAAETLLDNPVRLGGVANVPVRLEIWPDYDLCLASLLPASRARPAGARRGGRLNPLAAVARRRLSTGSRRRSREERRRSYPLGVVPSDAGGAGDDAARVSPRSDGDAVGGQRSGGLDSLHHPCGSLGRRRPVDPTRRDMISSPSVGPHR